MDNRFPLTGLPMGSFYPAGYPPLPPSESFQQSTTPTQNVSIDALGGYPEYEDPRAATLSMPGTSRRRRTHSGSEHAKHRRTRSGCYTCRQRRVKCDETHPICERCRKGKRECSYPGSASSASSKSAKGPPSARDSPNASSPSASDDETEDGRRLSAIPDDGEPDVGAEEDDSQSTLADSRRASETSLATDPTISPTLTSPSTFVRAPPRPKPNRTNSRTSNRSNASQSSRWASLSKDVKFYLEFFRDNMTHHHYAFKRDDNGFVHATLLDMALADSSSALLYGIVAFAAYHHEVVQTDSKISTFLSYYNKSIMFLQHSLSSKKHSVATLLTILQLAAIEEHLGDWVNLLGHQRAAYQIFSELYTLQNVTRDETSRRAIAWYYRFDVFAGFMSGGKTTLDRQWPATMHAYYEQQILKRPSDHGVRLDALFAEVRLLAADTALLFAATITDGTTTTQYHTTYNDISERLASLGRKIDVWFPEESAQYVTAFPKAPPPSEDDICDFRDPHFLRAGDQSTLNFALIDYWAIELTLKYRGCIAERRRPPPECLELGIRICKMFEAIEYGDEGPAGGVLGAQAGLQMAAMCLPRDEKHTSWLCRKFARVEQVGYTYSAPFRERMSAVLQKDATHWWLPNEEGLPSMLRQMREFVKYRGSLPTDEWSQGVRDMTGFFRSMRLG